MAAEIEKKPSPPGEKAPKQILVLGEIKLEPRPGDVYLDVAAFSLLGPFSGRRSLSALDRFPGSVVLRRFKADDVICFQGAPGNSAFYILTETDQKRLAENDGQAPAAGKSASPPETKTPPAAPSDSRPVPVEAVAETHLRDVAEARIVPVLVDPQPSVAVGGPSARTPRPISKDIPVELDQQTLSAKLKEGDVFGEMSCLTRQPRSATVIATAECQVIEFTSRVLAILLEEESYRRNADRIYSQRVLETHLKGLQLFQDLDPDQLATLKAAARLEVVQPGAVICYQGEQPDGPADIFIVRSGTVAVMHNARISLTPGDVTDWPGLIDWLTRPESQDGSAAESATRKSLGPNAPESARVLKAMNVISDLGLAGEATPSDDSLNRDWENLTRKTLLADAEERDAVQTLIASRLADELKAFKDRQKAFPKMLTPAMKAKKLADIQAMRAAAEKPGLATGVAAIVKYCPPDPAETKAIAELLRLELDPKAAQEAKDKDLESALPAAQNLAAVQQLEEAGVRRAMDAPSAATLLKTRFATPDESIQQVKTRLAALDSARGEQQLQIAAELLVVSAEIKRRSAEAQASRDSILRAFNEHLGNRAWLGDPAILPLLDDDVLSATWKEFAQAQNDPKAAQDFLKDLPKKGTEFQIRSAARIVLGKVLSGIFTRHDSAGVPRTLDYLIQGDCFGEMALVLGQPRSASSVAYDYPSSDSTKDLRRVELIRIPGAVLNTLRGLDNPAGRNESARTLDERVQKLARERMKLQSDNLIADQQAEDIASPEFQEMGLFQGQQLLIIDLDRCTRCGDCVRACEGTHSDGYTRLYLDGPKFGKYLVPSSCRQCRNPSCVTDCPVAAIAPGENGQIVIQSWCIGCANCADCCPYDSIQLQDVGAIPESADGWFMAPDSQAPARWQSGPPAGWQPTATPVRWTLDSQAPLAKLGGEKWNGDGAVIPEPLCFITQFQMPRSNSADSVFRLQVWTDSVAPEVWLNERPVVHAGAAEPGKRASKLEAFLTRHGSGGSTAEPGLAPGLNTLAIRIAPAAEWRPDYGKEILNVRMDAVPVATQKLIDLKKSTDIKLEIHSERAVVCDLCSGLPSQQPACVTMCPHDAAIRVDALSFFSNVQ